jgi:hypothetical protein
MISLSVDNKMKEETTKNHPKRHDNTHGRRKRRRSSKETKKTLTSKQKVNVNIMGS